MLTDPPAENVPPFVARVDAALASGQLELALAEAESAVSSRGDGLAWACLGRVRAGQGRPVDAAVAFSAARDHFASAGDVAQSAVAEGNLAAALVGQGQTGAALDAWAAAVARCAAAGVDVDPYLRVNFGWALLSVGDLDGCLRECSAAIVGAEAVGLRAAAGAARRVAAEGLGRAGQNAHAQSAFAGAVRDFTAAGLVVEAARTQLRVAALAYATDDPATAAVALRLALDVLGGRLDPSEEAGLRVDLGGIYYDLHDHVLALAELDRAAGLLPEHLRGGALDTRLRGNRGLAAVVAGRFPEADADLRAAIAGYQAAGDVRGEAQQLAMLSNLHRYQDQLVEAIALQERVIALESAHGFRVEEPGGLMYSGIEDRALNLFAAQEGHDKVADGGRQLPPCHLDVMPSAAFQTMRGADDGPVLMIAPPCYGAFGPIFPRGATAVASHLSAHGVPAVVLPLAHYVDDFAGGESARARQAAVIADAIQTLRPRAVGLSPTFSYLYPRTQEMARLVRQLSPHTPILIGGPHVTYQDRECLAETPEIDIVVRGEGEWTALELMRALDAGADLSGVLGITFRAPDGSVVRNKNRPLGDVRELPEIDFSLLPERFCREMEISAITSRGCTFRCKYCHEFRYWGGVVRAHDPARILRELEVMGRDYDNPLQGIDDSMLDMTTPYFMDLVDQVGRSPWLPEKFGFLTRLDTISAEGLVAMRRARIPSLSVGAESGSQLVLDAMNKGLKVEQTTTALALARDAGIATSAFFIIGHPGDSRVEFQKTMDFVDTLFRQRLVAWTDLSIFTPYPGTPFYSMPDRYGVQILERDWSLWRRANRPIVQLDTYPAGEIYLDYLRLLELQSRHVKARAADLPTRAPASALMSPA